MTALLSFVEAKHTPNGHIRRESAPLTRYAPLMALFTTLPPCSPPEHVRRELNARRFDHQARACPSHQPWLERASTSPYPPKATKRRARSQEALQPALGDAAAPIVEMKLKIEVIDRVSSRYLPAAQRRRQQSRRSSSRQFATRASRHAGRASGEGLCRWSGTGGAPVRHEAGRSALRSAGAFKHFHRRLGCAFGLGGYACWSHPMVTACP